MGGSRTPEPGRLAVAVALCVTGPLGAEPDPGALFVDRTAEAGLLFAHHNGMTGELHYSEMMGGGAALFDYDGDGDLDVYLVQGGPLDAAPRIERLTDRMFRNDGPGGPGGPPRFIDVTPGLGARVDGYGMGVATADFDNDGWTDLYVTQYGPNRLLRNRGDGTFADVTLPSGADDARWSIAATFLDFDRDGWMDLFVANYVSYDLADSPVCHDLSGRATTADRSPSGPSPTACCATAATARSRT